MSNWEEKIREQLLASKPIQPDPNWDKMAGMLDRAANARAKNYRYLAACISALVLIGSGLGVAYVGAQRLDLPRQYAFQLLSADVDAQSESSSTSAGALPSVFPQLMEMDRAMSSSSQRSLTSQTLFSKVKSDENSREVAAEEIIGEVDSNTQIQEPPQQILNGPDTRASLQKVAIDMGHSDDTLSTEPPASLRFVQEPTRKVLAWQIGLRGHSLVPIISLSPVQAGDMIVEVGYGAQPGIWVDLSCLAPGGWEWGAGIGGGMVWYPVSPRDIENTSLLADVWGKAFGGFLQGRKYFLPKQTRLRPFALAQLGMLRQQLTVTEFEYQINTIEDPHSIWRYRKTLPESAIVTTQSRKRSVLAASGGLGLQVRLNQNLGVYVSSQLQRQIDLQSPISQDVHLASGPNLFWEHSLGLRLSL